MIAKARTQCQVVASICGSAKILATVCGLAFSAYRGVGMVNAVAIQLSMSMLASTLSIASSVGKFMNDRGVSAGDALKIFRQTATVSQRQALANNDVEDAVLKITVISAKLLDQLAKEAQACEDKHIADRQKAATDTEKTQADIDAGSCMCRVLRDIKRYNKASLPLIFQNWWDAYSCRD